MYINIYIYMTEYIHICNGRMANIFYIYIYMYIYTYLNIYLGSYLLFTPYTLLWALPSGIISGRV